MDSPPPSLSPSFFFLFFFFPFFQCPSPSLSPSPPPSNVIGIYSNYDVVDPIIVENLVYDLNMLGFSPTLLPSQPTNWSTAPSVYIVACCPGHPNAEKSPEAINLYSNTEPNYNDLNNFVARGGLVIVLQGEYYDKGLVPLTMSSLDNNLLDTISVGVLNAANAYYGQMVQKGGWPDNFTIPTTYATHWYLYSNPIQPPLRSLQSIPSAAAWTLYAVSGASDSGSIDPVVTLTQPIISGSASIGYVAWLGCDWAVSEGSVTGSWTNILAQTIKTFSIQALYSTPVSSPSQLPASPPPPFPPLPPGTYLITAYAGTGLVGSGPVNGVPAVDTNFYNPYFMVFDPLEKFLYISDSGNAVVRKIDIATGIISATFVTQSARLFATAGLAFDASSNLYVSDNSQSIIIKVDAITNEVTIFAGVSGAGGSGYMGDNGYANDAKLSGPAGLTIYQGILYVADFLNHCIRAINLNTNIINTVVGNGTSGYLGDGDLATNALLSGPAYVVFDSNGNMFISEFNNKVIRRVDAISNLVSTFAGDGSEAYDGETIPSFLSSPLATLYILPSFFHRRRGACKQHRHWRAKGTRV